MRITGPSWRFVQEVSGEDVGRRLAAAEASATLHGALQEGAPRAAAAPACLGGDARPVMAPKRHTH